MSIRDTVQHYTPGLLPDSVIRHWANNHAMITPFVDRGQNPPETISYGLSSYGYDVRLGHEFITYTNLEDAPEGVLDPKAIDPRLAKKTTVDEGYITIPPHGFVLGTTLETFKIPTNVLVIALAKSTYARVSLVVGVTPIEPGFEGEVTLELSNTSDLPVRVYVGEGICQFLFFRGITPCEVSYADKGGKYMNQVGVTLPRMPQDKP